MDPERIHAYLQAACAGLGFDIGEVWFSSNETGSSTVAKIGKLSSSLTWRIFSRYNILSMKEKVKFDISFILTVWH